MELKPKDAFWSAVVVAALALVISPLTSRAQDDQQLFDMQAMGKLGTALQQYIADKDDWFPTYFSNSPVCLPNAPQLCGYKSMWQFAVYPYFNDWSIFNDFRRTAEINPEITAFNIRFGYNYSYLSTLCIQNDSYSQSALRCLPSDSGSLSSKTFFLPVPASHVENENYTILLTDLGASDLVSASTVGSGIGPPDAYNAPVNSFGVFGNGWGAPCQTFWAKRQGTNFQGATGKWEATGGFADRFDGRANIMFTDGHISLMTAGEASVGTNWARNKPCPTVTMTDESKYRWSPNYRGQLLP